MEQKWVPQWVVLTQLCVSGVGGAPGAQPGIPWQSCLEGEVQQPGDVTCVLAGSPLFLMASVATERLCFSETFLSVELSLWQGEERRSNFNNLIKYIM